MQKSLFIIGSNCSFKKESILEKLCNINIAQNNFVFCDSNSIKKFNDGEIRIELKIQDQDVSFNQINQAYIIQSICDPVNDSLMETLLLIDALKRAGIVKINLFFSYLAYARQDRRVKSYQMIDVCQDDVSGIPNYAQVSEPLSFKLVCNLLDNSGACSISILDPHFSQCEGFFNKLNLKIFGYEFIADFFLQAIFKILKSQSIKNFNCLDSLLGFLQVVCKENLKQKYCNFKSIVVYRNIENYLQNHLLDMVLLSKDLNILIEFLNSDFCLISPDAGALKKTRDLALILNTIINLASKFVLNISSFCEINVCFVEKIRSQPGCSEAVSLTGEIKNKFGLVIDDILDSGSTLVNSVKVLKNYGALNISACITHGLLSGKAIEKIGQSEIDNLFMTNSVASINKKHLNEKFIVFDLINIIEYIISF